MAGIKDTPQKPTKPMLDEARAAGKFKIEDMARDYNAISIVPVIDIVEHGKTLDVPMSLDVVRAAQRANENKQLDWLLEE